ncbi:MAG TPA: DnaB-like helicase C-terminal domain-containing protein, partial [Thermoanaerobaculia bacterium]|nr:DnaB-like helicase C-terminal domain-containing protein [Thermoanaerobaculia bacterium]
GKARLIVVLQAKVGKDVSDHLDAGHKIQDLVEAKGRPVMGLFSASDLYEAARERLTLTEADLPTYDPLGSLGRHFAFRNGRITLLGGYTGDGKTALALQATRGLCSFDKVPTLYVSMEMTPNDLTNRLLEHKGLPLNVLERPWEIPGSKWDKLYTESIEEIRSWDLNIMFKPGATADEIVKQAWDTEAGFVVIDHVHRFSWGNERRALEEQLMKLTNLALEYNIPVFILGQLRRFARGKDMETYPRPNLQDFRETEAFGNEAALAMAVWRMREKDGISYAPTGASEIIVLKNRYGPLASSMVWFDGPRQLFLPKPVAQPEVVEAQPAQASVHSQIIWGT